MKKQHGSVIVMSLCLSAFAGLNSCVKRPPDPLPVEKAAPGSTKPNDKPDAKPEGMVKKPAKPIPGSLTPPKADSENVIPAEPKTPATPADSAPPGKPVTPAAPVTTVTQQKPKVPSPAKPSTVTTSGGTRVKSDLMSVEECQKDQAQVDQFIQAKKDTLSQELAGTAEIIRTSASTINVAIKQSAQATASMIELMNSSKGVAPDSISPEKLQVVANQILPPVQETISKIDLGIDPTSKLKREFFCFYSPKVKKVFGIDTLIYIECAAQLQAQQGAPQGLPQSSHETTQSAEFTPETSASGGVDSIYFFYDFAAGNFSLVKIARSGQSETLNLKTPKDVQTQYMIRARESVGINPAAPVSNPLTHYLRIKTQGSESGSALNLASTKTGDVKNLESFSSGGQKTDSIDHFLKTVLAPECLPKTQAKPEPEAAPTAGEDTAEEIDPTGNGDAPSDEKDASKKPAPKPVRKPVTIR